MNQAYGCRQRDELAGSLVIKAQGLLFTTIEDRVHSGDLLDHAPDRIGVACVTNVDVCQLMIRNGERPAVAGVERLGPQLLAHAQEPRLAQRPVDVNRSAHIDEAVLRKHDDAHAALTELRDERTADAVDRTKVVPQIRMSRSQPLHVVVEVRKVDQQQRRREPSLHRC